jgi:hypothetical protein
MNEPTIDQLAQKLTAAKAAMRVQQDHIRSIEESIVNLFGSSEEGVTNFEGIGFKLSTTGVLNRTLEKDSIYRMKNALPGAVFDSIINVAPKLDVAALKKLASLDPESYRIAMEFVICKPGKTSVSVKEIN